MKETRKALKLSQAEMALKLGISQPSISRFERNPEQVDERTRLALKALAASI